MIDPRARARATAIAAAVIGLFVATGVVAYSNFGAVLAAMRPIGVAGFIAVIVAQLALFIPLCLAWWLVAPGEPIRRAPAFAWSRLVREAASDVLPFSQLGGLVIAARAAVLGGTPTATAFGSSLVDVTVEIVAQLIYTLVGVALLAHRLGFAAAKGDKLLFSLVVGLVIAAVLVGVMVATQRRGLNLIEHLFHRLAPGAGHHATAVNTVVEAAYGRRLQLWEGLGLHVFAWFGAAGGTWLILVLIGHRLPFLSVAAIESLLFAIRNAAFVVPSGLGVQEGAYALLGPLFGLPVEAALALSLLKRARDIAVGIPMLLSWQLLESRRRLRDS
jgi:glycosyltransferase 2 family protein